MNIDEIIKICNGEIICGKSNIKIKSFSTDTRTLKKGACFIALKGEKYNGCCFVTEAFKKKASVCIVDQNVNYVCKYNEVIIKVEDTMKCLKQLAKYIRNKSNVKVIAITGSSGKTTTKDLIAYTLSKKYKVLKTPDNNNNVIGLSNTLLSLKNEKIVVLEMGMNHMHEIEEMSYIASPDIAVITNIGMSHIGYLKTKKNVMKAKLEIIKYLRKDGIVIINNDDELLNRWKNKKYYVVSYGIEKTSDYNIRNLRCQNDRYLFDIDDLKNFNINKNNKVILYSILSSYIVAKILSLNVNKIKKSIEKFNIPNNRCEVIKRKHIIIINDSYNASFESMKSSINYLATYNNRKIAVLGDMLELGKYSIYLHKLIKKELIDKKIDIVITVGDISKVISDGLNNSYHFENIDDAIKKVNEIKKTNDVILVKASHKMNFKKIVDEI